MNANARCGFVLRICKRGDAQVRAASGPNLTRFEARHQSPYFSGEVNALNGTIDAVTKLRKGFGLLRKHFACTAIQLHEHDGKRRLSHLDRVESRECRAWEHGLENQSHIGHEIVWVTRLDRRELKQHAGCSLALYSSPRADLLHALLRGHVTVLQCKHLLQTVVWCNWRVPLACKCQTVSSLQPLVWRLSVLAVHCNDSAFCEDDQARRVLQLSWINISIPRLGPIPQISQNGTVRAWRRCHMLEVHQRGARCNFVPRLLRAIH